jgi:NIPSNAP
MLKKIFPALLITVAAAAVGFWFGKATTAHADDKKVFEIRTYTTEEGKLDALQARFRDNTVRIFKKHGMTSVGYFAPTDEPLSKNTLIYVLSFPSRDAAKQSWKEFVSDPEWQKVQKESEANGKIVAKITSVFANATDFSPLQ